MTRELHMHINVNEDRYKKRNLKVEIVISHKFLKGNSSMLSRNSDLNMSQHDLLEFMT